MARIAPPIHAEYLVKFSGIYSGGCCAGHQEEEKKGRNSVDNISAKWRQLATVSHCYRSGGNNWIFQKEITKEQKWTQLREPNPKRYQSHTSLIIKSQKKLNYYWSQAHSQLDCRLIWTLKGAHTALKSSRYIISPNTFDLSSEHECPAPFLEHLI